MNRDQIIGVLLIIFSIVVAVIYIWSLFLAPLDLIFLGISIREWAIIIPMLIVVLGILGILGWIGYTLATTPSPEEQTALEEEEKEKKEE